MERKLACEPDPVNPSLRLMVATATSSRCHLENTCYVRLKYIDRRPAAGICARTTDTVIVTTARVLIGEDEQCGNFSRTRAPNSAGGTAESYRMLAQWTNLPSIH